MCRYCIYTIYYTYSQYMFISLLHKNVNSKKARTLLFHHCNPRA